MQLLLEVSRCRIQHQWPRIGRESTSKAYRNEPTLGLDIEALALVRSNPDAFPLVVNDSSEVIETSDLLEPELVVGSRISVTIYNLWRAVPGWDMDFIFLGIDDTVADAVINASDYTPATTDLRPIHFGGIPATPTSSYRMNLDSDLDSGEWCLGYRPMPRLRLTAGLRWLRLDEHYDILESAALTNGTRLGFFSRSSNDAIGFQVGGEALTPTTISRSQDHYWVDSPFRHLVITAPSFLHRRGWRHPLDQ